LEKYLSERVIGLNVPSPTNFNSESLFACFYSFLKIIIMVENHKDTLSYLVCFIRLEMLMTAVFVTAALLCQTFCVFFAFLQTSD